MSATALTTRWEFNSVADTALKTAARFWFFVTVAGQWIFAFYVASFYGSSAARGNLEAWNKRLANGWVAGDTVGNAALGAHLLFAATITFSGALQLIPQIRARFPVFHRWNGRTFLLTAFTMAVSGPYLLLSGRKVVGDALQHVALGINSLLIVLCAAMALRYALGRDFKTHRRWALRLFVVVSGVWFSRVALMLTLLLFKGPIGFDPTTFQGPLVTFLSFAQYLLPLAVLELYLRIQERGSVLARFGTAATLSGLTVATGAGIFAATMTMWLPNIKAAFDNRISIAETLFATVASGGIDAAARQYHDLKATGPATYNFDEDELNALGYKLMAARKFKEAIGILQLNVQAYPQSSNVYDSLAEAYMDDGDKPQAIANYRKSVELNPNNRNAIRTIQKLNGP
jgi:tetratricopeptide (TPR) repeat protein